MKLQPLLILLLTALPTFARLGETKAECESRYGKPVKTTDDGITIFQKEGISIQINFWKEKASRIIYTKDNPKTPALDTEIGEPLTETELDTFLKANSGGSEWSKETFSDDNMTFWKRADTKAKALYGGKSKQLIIVDPEFAKYAIEEEEKKEDKKLEGF